MFSWAKNIPLYTFSTLDLLLSKFKNKDGLYVSKIDARRGNSFVKVVEIKKGVWVTHLEDVFMPNPELDQLIQSQYARAIIFNEIKEDNFNSVDFLKSNVIHRVEDVYGLVPSYLRSGI
jgi:tRNA A37 threonylcarbamoyladenosine modification protein TsaB